jgi:hypothetical protein
MRKVYIAGPYTKGDVAINVRKAITAGEVLAQEGFIPFVPHLTHFWHLIHPHDVEYWYQYDMHWLECCDCLLRLDGDSKGADEEMRRMASLGKPIFMDIVSLVEYYEEKEKRGAPAPG